MALADAPSDLHIRVADEHAGTQKLLPLIDVLSSSLDHPIAGQHALLQSMQTATIYNISHSYERQNDIDSKKSRVQFRF